MMQNNLLREITRCPNVLSCFQGNINSHPCSRIIQHQRTESINQYQVPEPWSGDIGEAAVLFLSSNPSISSEEEYPTWNWSDEEIQDFFTNRFGNGRKVWIREGKQYLQKDCSYSRSVAFWAAVRKRAEELYQREVIPGQDYVLSEVVHCKSTQEIGVTDALNECVSKYLKNILSRSNAKIIVILGSVAKTAINQGIDICINHKSLISPVEIKNKKRLITFLPHPNARMARTFGAILSEVELNTLQGFLRSNKNLRE
jgi:uracil-DNA glycosylase